MREKNCDYNILLSTLLFHFTTAADTTTATNITSTNTTTARRKMHPFPLVYNTVYRINFMCLQR